MATPSGILAWRISRTEETTGYSPRSRKESDRTEGLSMSMMLGDNARYCVKILVHKEVYQYFLLYREKKEERGGRVLGWDIV